MLNSKLQNRARARANLKRQLTNSNLVRAIDKAIREDAISKEEREELTHVKFAIGIILTKWFDNTKKVGLKAKRRWPLCGRIAKYKVIYPSFETYRCNKCIEFDDKSGNYQEINPDE